MDAVKRGDAGAEEIEAMLNEYRISLRGTVINYVHAGEWLVQSDAPALRALALRHDAPITLHDLLHAADHDIPWMLTLIRVMYERAAHEYPEFICSSFLSTLHQGNFPGDARSKEALRAILTYRAIPMHSLHNHTLKPTAAAMLCGDDDELAALAANAGADINAQHGELMQQAACEGKTGLMYRLAARGANIAQSQWFRYFTEHKHIICNHDVAYGLEFAKQRYCRAIRHFITDAFRHEHAIGKAFLLSLPEHWTMHAKLASAERFPDAIPHEDITHYYVGRKRYASITRNFTVSRSDIMDAAVLRELDAPGAEVSVGAYAAPALIARSAAR